VQSGRDPNENFVKGGAGGNGGAISYSPLNSSNFTITKDTICNIVVGQGSTSKDNDANPSSLRTINKEINAQGGTHTFSDQWGTYWVIYANPNLAVATGGVNNHNGITGGVGGQNGYAPISGSATLINISDININNYYGGSGGGGGGGGSSQTGGTGGNGGDDGRGGSSNTGNTTPASAPAGYPGVDNYGGGGGGGAGYFSRPSAGFGSNGGNGGSGVVIIYFPTNKTVI